MTSGDSISEVDLTLCDQEPIHIPGSIQPHGALVALDEHGSPRPVLQLSANVEELFGAQPGAAVGKPLEFLLGETAKLIEADLDKNAEAVRPVLLRTISVASGAGGERAFQVVAHKRTGAVVVEFEIVPEREPVPDIHALVDKFTLEAGEAGSVEELSRLAANEVRRLTGFDRVLVYRFDEGWNGTVIGESGSGRLPSLMDHRFPASDIPAQARALYEVNRTRIIPNARYEPVPLVPASHPRTGAPLDLSFSILRSVSPAHLEYMRNMETDASASVSIIRNGRLWGLVSCHHREPKTVSFLVRSAADLIARTFALRLVGLELSLDYERKIELRSIYSALLALMTDQLDFVAPLTSHPAELLRLGGASGAAVLTEGTCALIGETPSETEVRSLAAWIFEERRGETYVTDALADEYPEARPFLDRAAGLLAVAISKVHPSFILWFRPEAIRTVKWGGDPAKGLVREDGARRLHPRRSFETWSETVRGRALPWSALEVDAVRELRNAVVGIVLRKAEQMAELNKELLRSNKELEAFAYSVSHDLRAPLRHIVGYAEILSETDGEKLSARGERCVKTIIESCQYAGSLVDRLLEFSRMGRSELEWTKVDLARVVEDVRNEVAMSVPKERKVLWRISKLPVVRGDLLMLRLAFRNLLDNAVKYTRSRDEAIVEVGCGEERGDYVIWVKDNGIGFDMKYADKLFGVFQRLHRMEEYEGTGIGLANVRRVMERHGGRAWADGKVGEGATVHLSLPKP